MGLNFYCTLQTAKNYDLKNTINTILNNKLFNLEDIEYDAEFSYFTKMHSLSWPGLRESFNFSKFFLSFLSLTKQEILNRRLTLKQTKNKSLKFVFVDGVYKHNGRLQKFAQIVLVSAISYYKKRILKIKINNKCFLISKYKITDISKIESVPAPISLLSFGKWNGLNNEFFKLKHIDDSIVLFHHKDNTVDDFALIEECFFSMEEKEQLVVFVDFCINKYKNYILNFLPKEEFGYPTISKNDILLLCMFKEFLLNNSTEMLIKYL